MVPNLNQVLANARQKMEVTAKPKFSRAFLSKINSNCGIVIEEKVSLKKWEEFLKRTLEEQITFAFNANRDKEIYDSYLTKKNPEEVEAFKKLDIKEKVKMLRPFWNLN